VETISVMPHRFAPQKKHRDRRQPIRVIGELVLDLRDQLVKKIINQI